MCHKINFGPAWKMAMCCRFLSRYKLHISGLQWNSINVGGAQLLTAFVHSMQYWCADVPEMAS